METSLDGTFDGTQEPPSDLALASSIPTADGTHFTASESLGAPENIGAGEEHLERQNCTGSEKATTETRHNAQAREADILHQEPHKGNCDTSTVAYQGDAIQHPTGDFVVEGNILRAEPMGNASSCTGWEDAYMASATTDDRPVAGQTLELHRS